MDWQFILPLLTFLVALISGIVIPIAMLLIKRFKSFDQDLLLIKDAIERVKIRSDKGEEEQNAH